MANAKSTEITKNGHELAPLNNTRQGPDGGRPGVTIVLQGPRGSIISRGSGAADQDPDRAAWSGKMQFFLSIIGYSVGLGNIWRFPYLCQQNGGGAFLIPFFIMLILEGIPLFLIELGIGQKMRLGSLGVWNTIHPWLGGIGISSCTVTFFVALYYNVIITWCFYYFFNSFQSPLPWASCPSINTTGGLECATSSETEYFWYRTTLDASRSITEPGLPKWWIVLCLLLAWLTVFFIVMKGIQSSGKVVYFTSLFPYIVLTIFFIKALTLEGAGVGLTHMYTPKLEKLLDPRVWLDAATQVFYSFGLAFGSIIAFGSYNPPKNNCFRDVILVSICNAFTAIYASAVIFSILGFMAVTNVPKCIERNKLKMIAEEIIGQNATEEIYNSALANISSERFDYLKLQNCSLSHQLENAAEGTGLAFIVFTQAIVELPWAPFWAIIFFLMLLALGLGSQIGMLEGMLCTLFDIEIFKRMSKPLVTGVLCLVCFLLGLVFTTGAGGYWLKMFDAFAGTVGLVVVAFTEMVAISYIYGCDKFIKDIYEMTGYKPGLFWRVTWRYLAPAIMLAILGSSLVFMCIEHPQYHAWTPELGQTTPTDFPGWALAIAILMVLAGILPIPMVFLLRRYQCLKIDINIHEGSIRRIDTTVSTKEMMTDVDEQITSPDGPDLTTTNTLKNKFTIGDFEV
ncbi:sodium-dependent neutral amino acid transporter B(0)AT3 isoform X2 [Photinus pyralis]|uniref:sodium-dependent neutral amino acid transporter B(0)AT3 isoform X2 n=1 Tax=Photinus pyralis TaxID=7054 RepID=UPI001266F14B|nr:sodium-dependent neutral amino acid transporter B(0)AT3 isoform X2 [Photinus pyralis]